MKNLKDKLDAMPTERRLYTLRNLPSHLAKAGEFAHLCDSILLNYSWIDAKLRAVSVGDVIRDFYLAGSQNDLEFIRDALRLSSHVLSQNPELLPSQLVGRLSRYGARQSTQRLLSHVRTQEERAWLCPLFPTLIPPGPLLCTFGGHTDPVTAVALSSDGAYALSSSDDSTVRLWDTSTGQALRTFNGHGYLATAVALGSDGMQAVVGSDDSMVRLWDTVSGCLLHTFQGHKAAITTVALSADGSRVVSGSDDSMVKLWDCSTGQLLHTFEGHANSVRSVALSTDGVQLLSGSDDSMVKLWDIGTGQLVRTFEGHSDSVLAVALNSDGKRALSGSKDSTIKAWDTTTGQLLCSFGRLPDSMLSLALKSEGTCVCSESDGRLHVWTRVSWWDSGPREGESLLLWPPVILKGHTGAVLAIALDSDGRLVLSGSKDSGVKIWDTYRASPEQHVPESHPGRGPSPQSDSVVAVVPNSDGTRVLSGSESITFRIWNIRTGRALPTATGQAFPSFSRGPLALSSDGSCALSGSTDSIVALWDVSTGHRFRKMKGHADAVTAVALSADGLLALSGSSDRTLKLWDTQSGHLLRTFEGHTSRINAVSLDLDCAHVLSGSSDGTVKLWDTQTGRLLHTLAGHSSSVDAVALALDGRCALSGSHDTKMKLWDTQTGQLLRTFEGHTSQVNCVALNRAGTRALSGSRDKMVVLWDTKSGQALMSFASDWPISSCAFLVHDESIICAGDEGGNVHILRQLESLDVRQRHATIVLAPMYEALSTARHFLEEDEVFREKSDVDWVMLSLERILSRARMLLMQAIQPHEYRISHVLERAIRQLADNSSRPLGNANLCTVAGRVPRSALDPIWCAVREQLVPLRERLARIDEILSPLRAIAATQPVLLRALLERILMAARALVIHVEVPFELSHAVERAIQELTDIPEQPLDLSLLVEAATYAPLSSALAPIWAAIRPVFEPARVTDMGEP